MAAQRADEALPLGRLSVRHYCDIHRHLFQDVYAWAGKFRTVRISKAGSMFCYPEHIPREMRSLFDRLKYDQYLRELADHDFVGQAAHFLATLNAIHPFRDGNGRTQLAFLALLATKAGHQLALTRLRPRMFRAAMVTSFHGDEAPLRRELRRLLDQPTRKRLLTTAIFALDFQRTGQAAARAGEGQKPFQGKSWALRLFGCSEMRPITSRKQASRSWPLSFAVSTRVWTAAARSPPANAMRELQKI
jgi:cell filamentation protein